MLLRPRFKLQTLLLWLTPLLLLGGAEPRIPLARAPAAVRSHSGASISQKNKSVSTSFCAPMLPRSKMIDPETLLGRLAARNLIAFAPSKLPASHRFAARDGLMLHYLDWPGAGDAIVFLHGGALTAHTWDLVCLDLGDQFRCIALDLRGHGLSDWTDDYKIESHVGDLAALTRHVGLQSFHVVGMSLGGNVAARCARSARRRASRASS